MSRITAFVVALSLASLGAFGADAPAGTEEAGVSTNAALRRKMSLEKSGGAIEKPLPSDAKFIVVDDRRAEKDGVAEKFASQVGAFLRLAARVGEPGEGDIVITLMDEGESFVSLDRPAASVAAGAEEKETLQRLMSALIRIIGIEGSKFVPQVYETAQRQAKALGLGQVRRTSYRKAVEEGWAPAPTNEFQQAIWDAAKVKAQAAPDAPDAKAGGGQ